MLREAGFAGVEKLKVFDLAEFPHDGGTVTISRTGFTGDLGYELFVAGEAALCRCGTGCWKAGELRGIRAIGYAALNRARLEAGLIVANADFITAEHALRADRVRMPDEIGLGFMIDLEKGHFNGRHAIVEARAQTARCSMCWSGWRSRATSRPNTPSSIIARRKEVGLVSAAIWSPTAKRNIALASLTRPYGDTVTDDLWVEIYAMRELQYEQHDEAREDRAAALRQARRAAPPTRRRDF